MRVLVSDLKREMVDKPGPWRLFTTPPTRIDSVRDQDMAALYRAGKTLAEIGDRYGLTRERVRQLLSRQGVSRLQGGQAKRTRQRRAAAKAEKEARFFRKYGMTRERFREVQRNTGAQGRSPLHCYKNQFYSAKERGIPWHFDFASWWDVWERSGKWMERGPGSGYVMARFNDLGPYAPNNVKVIPGAENQREFINRYWAEVYSGKREPAPKQARGPRGSRYGFHLLVDQDRVVVEDENTRNVQAQALNYARMHGWKVKTKTSGGRVTVERVA